MIDASSSAARTVRFGPFELDLRSGELRKNGSRVGLQDQPLRVLSVLLERPGELVTREELRLRLWPADTFVDFEHGLNAAVKRLRDALGDSAEAPRFVETIPRRGYRFRMTVDSTATSLPPVGRRMRSPGRWISVTIVAAFVATALLIAARIWRPTRVVHGAPAPVRFTIDVEQSGVTGAGIECGRGDGGFVASCPDGSCIAYRGAQQGTGRLYLHSLDRLTSAAIPNTEGGCGPFFSPDGRWLGFFADGRLKKISLDKLGVETLCDAPDARGATWAPDGHIFFAATATGPILRVSDEGGAPEAVTRLDEGSAEVSHSWPVFLPDEDRLLYQSTDASGRSRIVSQSLATGRRQTLLDRGEYPRFAASGHLLFSVGESLRAVPFNAGEARLDGSPVELAEKAFGVSGGSNGQGMFDVSRNGVFAYIQLSRRIPDSTLWRVQRSGRASQLTDLRRAFQWPRFSPDGRRLAVTITDGAGSNIWTYDLLRQSLTRLTFDGSDNEAAIWAPDGRRFAFRSNRAGPFNLFQEPADGAGPVERLVTSSVSQFPGSWSPDGRALMFQEPGLATDSDIWVLSLTGDHTRKPFVNSEYGEWDGLFSPDGRRVAYTSLESGRLEVYVRPYPGPGSKRQVSNEGGNSPVWSRSGKELFYMNGRKMMAVTIGARSELIVGKPELLFEGDYAFAGYLANFDVTPDDRAFVMVRSEQRKSWVQLNVVLNWFDELKRRVPRQP